MRLTAYLVVDFLVDGVSCDFMLILLCERDQIVTCVQFLTNKLVSLVMTESPIEISTFSIENPDYLLLIDRFREFKAGKWSITFSG